MKTQGTYPNGNQWINESGIISIKCAVGGCVHYRIFQQGITNYTVTTDARHGQNLNTEPHTLSRFHHTHDGVLVHHTYGTRGTTMREWTSPATAQASAS
ncbi:hypothetical protein [Timonella sp. A28]|uniref:hypothetical protein n=1 Tax=Timonella sp. A28 TaxID=3442640 RepID=UPI003EBE3237